MTLQGSFFTASNTEITQGLSLDNTFFSQSFLKNLKVGFDTITDGVTEIQVLRMDDNKTASKNIENLLLLCLTQPEMSILNGISGLKNNHHKFLKLTDEFHDVAGGFYKYKLKVQGLDATTLENSVESPSSDIWVYTKDGLVFATPAFTGSLPIPTTVARNYEELIGVNDFEDKHKKYEIHAVNISAKLITLIGTNPFYNLGIDTDINHTSGTFTILDSQIVGGNTQLTVEQNITAAVVAGNDIEFELNYEDFLIGKDKETGISSPNDKTFRELVNEFQISIKAIPDTVAARNALENLVTATGESMYLRGVATAKLNSNANADDRPLYWSRIKLGYYLRSHPFLIRSAADSKDIMELFEEKSRNYTNINFSVGDAVGAKRILVTGFDPFLLNSKANPNWHNILQSNPAGSVALSIHDSFTANGLGYIQTLIVPVRYQDFDGSASRTSGQGLGIIEKYISSLVDEVDMIVTVSQTIPPYTYNVDRYATSTRGGFGGNMDFTRVVSPISLPTSRSVNLYGNKDFEWIETTLPTQMQVSPAVLDSSYVDNSGNSQDGAVTPPSTSPKEQMREGSGGDYLSNEIFYRVARLRQIQKPTLKTGHLHIKKLQDSSVKEDFDQTKTKNLVTDVKTIINNGSTGL